MKFQEFIKLNVRSDLAIDIVNDKHTTNTNVKRIDNMVITTVDVDETLEKELDKKKGKYITIEFDDINNINNLDHIISAFKDELFSLMQYLKIKESDSVLIIGLGNDKSTPDSLGPLAVEQVLVTKHLLNMGFNNHQLREVSAFSPGVMGETGIETSDMISSVINTTKPSFLIVIDALASNSLSRINKTIQITDSGINPGSGIGNKRKEISREILNIPVIAIGIPTVVDAVTIVAETIKFTQKKLGYAESNIHKPKNKLIVAGNYLDNDYELKNKQHFMGLLGTLSDSDMRQLIYEVLYPIGYNLMVTPKEIDFLINKLSKIIAEGINKALHPNLNNFVL